MRAVRGVGHWLLVLAAVLLAGSARAQSYGLGDTAVPVGPFLNGVMPPRTPADPASSQWDVTTAFPNLPALNTTLVIASTPANNRLYVASRGGSIVSFENTPTVSSVDPFLDLTDRVAIVWDGGFLNMVFHPQFGQPGSPFRKYVYVYYSSYCPMTADGDTVDMTQCTPNYPQAVTYGFFNCYLRLSRFEVPDGSIAADKSTEKVLINIRLYNSTHRGGGMTFGNDGYLYLMIGEQEYPDWAQDIVNHLAGGTFRMAVDVADAGATWTCPAGSHTPRRVYNSADETSGRRYCIPDDNPWLDPGGGNYEEYWTLGHRNPHRLTRDTATGRLWGSEVGDHSREEVNIILKGCNYGWPYREGLTVGIEPMPPTILGTLTDPVIDFNRQQANAIIGGYVYNGTRFPELVGKYLAGDDITNNIWAVTLDPQTMTATEEQIATFSPVGLGTWGQDNQGEVYLGSVYGTKPVYTLERLSNPVPDPPALLSQLGIFTDLASLTPASYFVPYNVNPFWSDGAVKSRWIALPNDGVRDTPAEQIGYSATNNWTFPAGTVLMKHFELPLDENNPNVTTRLETRFMVYGNDGRWYGLTYQWLPDQSDAVLLTSSATTDYTIKLKGGGTRQQTWYFPSRDDCMRCHNDTAGGALGPRTHQLNRSFQYPSTGITDNQLRTWNHLGMLSPPLDESTIPTLLQSREVGDVTASLQDRARGWLDSNCSQCHRPGNQMPAFFDARLTTPLQSQLMVNGTVVDTLNLPNAHVLTPGDPSNSVLYQRAAALGEIAMPPLAKNLVQDEAVTVLANWIQRVPPNFPQGGLLYEYYKASADSLATFTFEDPTVSGQVETFDLSASQDVDGFVMRFTGLIEIDTAGTYTFYTTSDDGSQLFIDGALVVDNDGHHGPLQQSGTVSLSPGFHAIVVTYFQAGGGMTLDVQWSGPGIAQEDIPLSLLYTSVPTPITNHAPTVTTLGNVTSQTGSQVSIPIAASDTDGDSLYYEASGLPYGVTMDPVTGRITGAAAAGTAGNYAVTVGVSDGPAVASMSFNWLVIAPSTSHCGLGAELAAVIPALEWLRRRRRAARAGR